MRRNVPVKPTVLIANDEPAIRTLLDLFLSDAGFSVCQAASGDEAVMMYARERTDLVLLDVRMPGQR